MEKKVLINQTVLRNRIKELAAEITQDYEGESLTLICILKGSLYFFADLSRRIDLDAELEFIRVQSYEGENSTGDIQMLVDLDHPITGKNVIVVEDIIDTGKTLTYLLKHLEKQKPKSLKLCTLLDKPERRDKDADVHVDYVGFTIPNHFVIGYGLDLDQKYRNLPEINCFIEEDQKKKLKEDKDAIKLQLKHQPNNNGNRH